MKEQTLVHKPLPQNPGMWVSVPNYKEPILPVSGGFGWYGLQAYDFQGDKLMCHECGKFFDVLSVHTSRIHKLNDKNYKKKYGLMGSTKLTSEKARINLRTNWENNPKVQHYVKNHQIMRKHIDYHAKKNKWATEFQNLHDTCPAQVLRALKSAAEIYGDNITESQTRQYNSCLVPALTARFGSFNKAKQMIGLSQNANHYPNNPLFTKQMILEDAICFYKKYGHWAKERDFKKGQTICSSNTVINFFGNLKNLYQEAQQLKDEQDKRASIDINAIANKIEMEYAGRARV